MRTDTTIDSRQVICRNASTIGYSSVKLRVGMFFVYSEDGDGDRRRLGRMIGRVSAPAIGEGENYSPRIEGYILALVLSDNGAHCYERWIDPNNVIETRDAEGMAEFAAFFFAERLPYDAATLRRLNEYGTLQASYIANAPKHVAAWGAGRAHAGVAS